MPTPHARYSMPGPHAHPLVQTACLPHLGMRSSSNSSLMKTRLTYSLMERDLAAQFCCSKGAMPGTNSTAVNSMVPSTLKCTWAMGSRNSPKVCRTQGREAAGKAPGCQGRAMCWGRWHSNKTGQNCARCADKPCGRQLLAQRMTGRNCLRHGGELLAMWLTHGRMLSAMTGKRCLCSSYERSLQTDHTNRDPWQGVHQHGRTCLKNSL